MLLHRWVLITVAACLIGASLKASPHLAAQAQQQEPPPTQSASADPNAKLCTVSGTVVSANTGEPLRRALIRLENQKDDDAKPIHALTNSSGEFEVTNIPPGSYEFSVTRDGYRGAHYLEASPGGEGATLALAPGQKLTELIFRLWKLGVISGRIVDSNGDPVQNVRVTAVIQRAGKKTQPMANARSVQTDDRGEYRLFNLRPGRYLLAASPPENHVVGMVEDPEISQFRQTFYPQTTNPARSTFLDVKSGDEISGMDMTLVSAAEVRTFVVRGRVIDNTGAKNNGGSVVRLDPRGAAILGFGDQRFAAIEEETGSFEIRSVTPGEYALVAEVQGPGGRFTSRQDVSVVASDPDSVTLVISRGVRIATHLNLVGKDALGSKHFRIDLSPWDGQLNGDYERTHFAETETDGTYVFNGVNDGAYRLDVWSACEVCFVKAADANGVDVLARGLQISGGAGPGRIDITYSSESGRMSGVVHNKDDAPAMAATVVVVSTSPHGERKTAQTDQYGHYEVKGLPPGDYNAYAFAHFDRETLEDADAMQAYADQRESVSVTANATRTLDLKLIPPADGQN
jgi:hypothetical protein